MLENIIYTIELSVTYFLRIISHGMSVIFLKNLWYFHIFYDCGNAVFSVYTTDRLNKLL